MAWLHFVYIITSLALSASVWFTFSTKWMWLTYVFLIGHLVPSWVCQCYWGRCPLTLLEQAYRTGQDQDTHRWKSLRRWHSHAEVTRWAFFQPFYVWLAFMLLASTYALIGVFTP